MSEDNLPEFATQLDGELQSDERLTSLHGKSISDVVRSVFTAEDELKSLRESSEGKFAWPGEETPDEDRDAFRGKLNEFLGVPKDVAGYEISKPDKLPDGMTYDDTLSDKMLETLHKHGASKELVHALFGTFNDYHVGLTEEFNKFRQEASEKDLKDLKVLWKDEFEQKNRETFEVLNLLADKIEIPEAIGGMEGFKADLESLGLTNNPRFNFLFHSLFEKLGDPALLFGSPSKEEPNEVDAFYPNMKKKK